MHDPGDAQQTRVGIIPGARACCRVVYGPCSTLFLWQRQAGPLQSAAHQHTLQHHCYTTLAVTSLTHFRMAQAKEARFTLEARVAALEAIVASMQPAVTAAVAEMRADTPLDEGS